MAVFFAAFALLAFFPTDAASKDQTAGAISALRGPVGLKEPGNPLGRELSAGDVVRVGDVVETGPDGWVQIVLDDDSMLILAPRSSVRVNQFAFDPKLNRRSAVVRVLEGKVRVTVYKIRSPESGLTVETSAASIIIDTLGDCVVVPGLNGSEIIVLRQAVRVRNILPYVVGETMAGENQKVTVREKQPPTSPLTVSAGERALTLSGITAMRGSR